jgi:hypothetical protein
MEGEVMVILGIVDTGIVDPEDFELLIEDAGKRKRDVLI